jgi:hypothetical protein
MDVPPHVWTLVVRDVEARSEGSDAGASDDALVLRYHELLDAAGYLRARIHERDGR